MISLERILLVEDQPLIALAQTRALEREGYTVLGAPSGEHALELFAGDPAGIDLVLMDIDLGTGMDGVATAHAILATRDLPIVFLSSHTEKEMVDRTQAIASYGFVVKSSGMSVLQTTIRMALKLHEAHRELRHWKQVVESVGGPDAFEHSESRHQRFLAAITDYTYSVRFDPDGSPRTVHGSGCLGITGYSCEDFDAAPYLWYDVVLPEDRPIVDRANDMLRRAEQPPRYEHRLRHKDGSIRWVRNTTVCWFDGDGRLEAYDGLIQDITACKRVEEELERSRSQKQAQLQELQHRMKNSLNTILSFINLQSLRVAPGKQMEWIDDLGSRVRAIHAVYALLSSSDDIGSIGLDDYVAAIAKTLIGTYLGRSSDISLELQLEGIRLDTKLAMPLGLILTELMTNALKYAYPQKKKGRIGVSLARDEAGTVSLIVADDGVGFPPGIKAESGGGTGLMLVRTLASQIEARVSFSGDRGVSARIDFDAARGA
jgi:PAS domain S-box-containing protein